MAQSESHVLPAAKDLKRELAASLIKREPLLVMVSLEGCAFCKIARDHYLRSLQRDLGLKIVQLDMRKSTVVVDFMGSTTSHERLIQSWGIKLAPTILFFGKGGKELVDRLTGGASGDFYGAYLDERVLKSLELSKY